MYLSLYLLENALSEERKKVSIDTERNYSKTMELQTNLEKAKEYIDQNDSKFKLDQSNKDLKIQQIENELERMKALLASKGVYLSIDFYLSTYLYI
jgi:hypothetical protein